MPKLVVMVEKDGQGKLWDYVFTQKDCGTDASSFGPTRFLIHKSAQLEDITPLVHRASSREDHVEIGVIQQHEEKAERIRIRKR